jgi:hypothetical protein
VSSRTLNFWVRAKCRGDSIWGKRKGPDEKLHEISRPPQSLHPPSPQRRPRLTLRFDFVRARLRCFALHVIEREFTSEKRLLVVRPIRRLSAQTISVIALSRNELSRRHIHSLLGPIRKGRSPLHIWHKPEFSHNPAEPTERLDDAESAGKMV